MRYLINIKLQKKYVSFIGLCPNDFFQTKEMLDNDTQFVWLRGIFGRRNMCKGVA